ncbi:MAG: mechanosensitive ion channel family protein [Oscillospiraceae bacterium]|nr:mechanosensitive ion channel family protein [Oscillospiraceae bacterium]
MTASIGPMALTTVLGAVLTFLVCLIAMKLLMKLVDKLLERATKLDGTLKGFIRSAAKILLWLLTVIIVAGALGIPTSSMVALISIAGLALSLSVQNILSNLFSGLTLLVTKPFQAGDYVEVAGKAGIVKTVGLFYTQLDSLDNVAISIPNSDICGSSVNNYSHEPLRRVDMTFCTSYDAATEDVKAAIMDAIGKDEKILMDPAPFVRLGEYKESVVQYIVRVWCKGADYWDVHFNLNENVRESFKEKGVPMSYAHVNVHVIDKK